jgi:hypothetical protein
MAWSLRKIVYCLRNDSLFTAWEMTVIGPQKYHHKNNIIHETAICHNPHSLSNWDFYINRQLGYRCTVYQNVVSRKNCFSLYFYKNITCSSVGLLMNCQVFSVSREIVYWWVMTNCRFMSDMYVLSPKYKFPLDCIICRNWWEMKWDSHIKQHPAIMQ